MDENGAKRVNGCVPAAGFIGGFATAFLAISIYYSDAVGDVELHPDREFALGGYLTAFLCGVLGYLLTKRFV